MGIKINFSFRDKINNNDTINKIEYEAIVIIIKPLDIINANESLNIMNINIEKTLWLQFESKLPNAIAANEIIKDMGVKTLYIPNPKFFQRKCFTKIWTRSRCLLGITFLTLFPLAYGWWIFAYLQMKTRLNNIEKPRYLLCDPEAGKLLPISILKPETVIFYDGGYSTIFKNYLQIFEKCGGFGLLKAGVNIKFTAMPYILKRKILLNCCKEPLFITVYSENVSQQLESTNKKSQLKINDYILLRQKFMDKNIDESFIIILGNITSGHNPNFLKNIREKIEPVFECQDKPLKIVYKPHPSEQIEPRVILELQVNNIEVWNKKLPIEFELLNIQDLPKGILSWNSSASIVLLKSLPKGVKIINIEDLTMIHSS